MGVSTGQDCDHCHWGFLSHYQMSPDSGGLRGDDGGLSLANTYHVTCILASDWLLRGDDGHQGQPPGTDVSDQPQQSH